MNTPQHHCQPFDVTETGIMDLSQKISGAPHVFIGVVFSDDQGETVTPSGGTYTIDINPVGMDNFKPIRGGTDIVATTSPELLDFATNAQKLRFTPNGITGADKIRITVTGNVS